MTNLDAQFLFLYVYFNSLHVSSNPELIIKFVIYKNSALVGVHKLYNGEKVSTEASADTLNWTYLNYVKSDVTYFASRVNKKIPRGQLATINFINDVDLYWRSQVQFRPYSPISIRWDSWSAWSLRRFGHGERVSGSHFTWDWLESRAGLSSGKRKILHA
jgi:hypothetical protein